MFTGIIQTTGVVQSIHPGSDATRLVVDAPGLERPIARGSSICVNGACLTVTDADERHITFDVVPETASRTTIASWTTGHRVNLERSLCMGDPLDGHIVQGHVDGTATVTHVRRGREGHLIAFAAPPDIMTCVIPKGSIALDGVSLTIATVAASGNAFTVAVIPTTLAITTLGQLRPGDRVNVETDILARTVITTLSRWHKSGKSPEVTIELLQENGFV
jgi:riboflavin synthase